MIANIRPKNLKPILTIGIISNIEAKRDIIRCHKFNFPKPSTYPSVQPTRKKMPNIKNESVITVSIKAPWKISSGAVTKPKGIM